METFLFISPRNAERAAEEVIARAKELGLYNRLPNGFFALIDPRVIAPRDFNNLAQIRQFPSFEITFRGSDGNIKSFRAFA